MKNSASELALSVFFYMFLTLFFGLSHRQVCLDVRFYLFLVSCVQVGVLCDFLHFAANQY